MIRDLCTRVLCWRLPAVWAIAAGFVIAVVVGTVDYLLRFDLILSLFYLIPVAMVAWYAYRWTAFAMSGICALICLLVDTVHGPGLGEWKVPVANAVSELVFFLITAALLSTLKDRLRHEQLLARTDALTHVFNCRAFEELGEKILQLAVRYEHPVALAYIDIDDFKAINDSAGHSAGDIVLQTVAQTLAARTRSTDIVGRLGGDEFGVLMPETNAEGARTASMKLRTELEQVAREHEWPVGFSIGVATFDVAPHSMDEALKLADSLMYRAKQRGKNQALFEEQWAMGLHRGARRKQEPRCRRT